MKLPTENVTRKVFLHEYYINDNTSYHACANWNGSRLRGRAGKLFQMMDSTLPLKSFWTRQL